MRIDPNTPDSALSVPTVGRLTAEGWRIIADGPSGVQLLAPKKMKMLDQCCLLLGAIIGGLFSLGAGLFLVLIALIDYWWLTKAETVFIPRGDL